MPSRRSAVWTMRHFLGLRTNFNSQIGLGFVCPVRRNGLATFSPQVCFYEAAFLCGLRLTVHPFIMELLDDFGIALELFPWERRTRIVRDLPSSFKYWKSWFFFVFGDDFETLSNEVWGDLPRLHNRWGTPNLGASLFLFVR